MSMNIPEVIFADGKDYFASIESRYKRHEKGLFIMTPSGAGKTYYTSRQAEPDWIDGDTVLIESGAQPDMDWWNQGVPVIERVEQRCDIITQQFRDKGYWIMTSINFWLEPDAIVIPDWETLTQRIATRQQNNYDGGMTSEHHEQLKKGIEIIERWHTEKGVPKFESIEEAVRTLTGQA